MGAASCAVIGVPMTEAWQRVEAWRVVDERHAIAERASTRIACSIARLQALNEAQHFRIAVAELT